MLSFIKKTFSKIIEPKTKKVLFILSIACLVLLIPNISSAENKITDFFFGVAGDVIGWFLFKISWFIALVGSFIIGILIWVLQVIILASGGLVNSPAVQTGFPILLSVANLGFVLAVIMIAIATIIRNQTYNIKKFLVNVVIMAVAVNFGLVISGAILGVSNRVTNYFLSSMTGGSPMKLADTIAGIVQPQKAITSISVIGSDNESASSTAMTSSTAEQIKVGAGLGSVITPVVGAWMSILVVIILVISFFSLIASFVVRYIKLTFLLILLPIAWMGSVLPGKASSWTGMWWKEFNKQAFYPPIVLFFLWLALRVGGNMTYKGDLMLPKESAGYLGVLVSGTLQEVLNQLVMAGILIGGNYAAKMAGAEVSSKAYDTAKSMQGWATGKVRTGLRRTGTRALDSGIVKKPAAALSRGIGSFGTRMESIGTGGGRIGKILGAPVRGLGTVVAEAGNVTERYATRAKDQMSAAASKSYKDDAAKMTDEELKVRAKIATGLELAAILDKASKDPKLMRGVIDNIPEANRKSLSGSKDLYKRYGYEKTYEAAMLESGMTINDKLPAFTEAKKKYEETKKDGSTATEEEKKKANEEFVKAEKEFTDAIKKLSADGANGLLFAKEKDENGKPTDKFVMPQAQREATIQQLMTKGGWNPGTVTDFLKKALEGNSIDEVRKLMEGMDAERINPAAIKAMKNGAMKNLGVGGEDVFGEELFNKAKTVHKIEDENKKPKVTFSE